MSKQGQELTPLISALGAPRKDERHISEGPFCFGNGRLDRVLIYCYDLKKCSTRILSEYRVERVSRGCWKP